LAEVEDGVYRGQSVRSLLRKLEGVPNQRIREIARSLDRPGYGDHEAIIVAKDNELHFFSTPEWGISPEGK
jgi:hypothetical protein